MTSRCTCLDASIRRTCCYNFHHYAAHTCRRLTLFCAGTANSMLCTPATTWPPRQLLALLPHVSMFHLDNPYIYTQTASEKHFFVTKGLKTCTFIKISKSIILQSQFFFIYATNMRKEKLCPYFNVYAECNCKARENFGHEFHIPNKKKIVDINLCPETICEL
jgi:hypothetical protein